MPCIETQQEEPNDFSLLNRTKHYADFFFIILLMVSLIVDNKQIILEEVNNCKLLPLTGHII